MKIRIKITKDILKRSINCSCNELRTRNCALAIALQEVFPDAWVGLDIMSFSGSSFVPTTSEMRDFINEFDGTFPKEERLELPEQSFEINVPDGIIKAISLHELETILSKSSTLELVKV